MRLLVFGGRDFGRAAHIRDRHKKPGWRTVYEQHTAMWEIDYFVKVLRYSGFDGTDGENVIEIISGMASGADRMGVIYARRNGLHLHEFPADWNRFGRRAGFLRNQQMIDEGKPDYALEFPGGPGTADMHVRLQRAGVPTRVVQYTAPSGRVSIWPRSNAWRRPDNAVSTPNSQSC